MLKQFPKFVFLMNEENSGITHHKKSMGVKWKFVFSLGKLKKDQNLRRFQSNHTTQIKKRKGEPTRKTAKTTKSKQKEVAIKT